MREHSGYLNAISITDDRVLEQTDIAYADNGLPKLVATRSRLHDAPTTSTGSADALTDSNSVVTYAGMVYDGANRVIQVVNYGTNIFGSGTDSLRVGGSAPTVPAMRGTAPQAARWRQARSTGARGLLERINDPRGNGHQVLLRQCPIERSRRGELGGRGGCLVRRRLTP